LWWAEEITILLVLKILLGVILLCLLNRWRLKRKKQRQLEGGRTLALAALDAPLPGSPRFAAKHAKQPPEARGSKLRPPDAETKPVVMVGDDGGGKTADPVETLHEAEER
jgi:hypothetical protein